ncbi:MAG: hypothetical protein HYS13_14565 [Planctomycetia bacterium]|nr:hypothetical protein [Planctomycetia bacterium]
MALIERCGDQFSASVLGEPKIRAVAATRDEAIAALRRQLEDRVARGDLVEIEFGPRGWHDLIGKFADDPTLREICEEAYRQRDEDRDSPL